MLKFLLGLFTGVLLVFLGGILLLVILFQFRDRPPEIPSNSVLVVRLEGEIPEKPAMEVPFVDNPRAAVTVASVWMALRRAAQDSRIRAVVLEPEGLSVGWAKLEEIRGDVEQFRKSGKPVFAYLRNPSAREYYLALAADRICLGPEDPLMLKGMRAEILYFRNTLAKIGVSVDVEHDGKYKDFGDMFTRSDMSPETKEVLNSLLDELYGNLVDRIAAARRKQPDQVRALIDQGPFSAPDALEAGLVDELRFEDQMWGELRQRLQVGEPNKVALSRYLKASPRTVPRNHFALVVAEGDIVRGDPSDDGGEGLTSYGFDKLLREAAADPLVKGILVRIDSPGGEVTASDEMWREMSLASRKRPVVISMSDVAASGGYYMALTGDSIVAYPETETGSIGVVFGKPNLHGLYDKLGITKDSLQRGRNAGIDSDYNSLDADQRALIERGIDQSYHEFVAKVATARHRAIADIEPVAEGRVWLGSQAKPRGLVDELGGLDAAVTLLKKKAGIATGEDVGLLLYPGRRNLLDLWLKRSQDDALEARLRAVFGCVPFRAWMRGGMLRMMPEWIEVR
ncbi:MAG TPA: signal peptide peptidase SppA [Bryobacteraceae bacterium]|jgi:protease-4